MSIITAERDVDAQWRDQHLSYGSRFASVYDRLFPAADAVATVDFLLAAARADRPVLAEFGIGTGRIAVPAARRGALVHGVDSSPELLTIARDAAQDVADRVILHEGDMRAWHPSVHVDLAYCVCATISMLPTRADQMHLLRRLAAAAGDGVVIVETHNPQRIHALHAEQSEVEFPVDVPGVTGGMHCISRLSADCEHWTLDHRWHEDGERRAREFSLLTSPQQLADLAAGAGLEITSLHSSWDASAYRADSPTYIAVMRKTSPRTTGGAR